MVLDRAARGVAGLETIGSNEADGVVRAERLALESRVQVDWMGPA